MTDLAPTTLYVAEIGGMDRPLESLSFIMGWAEEHAAPGWTIDPTNLSVTFARASDLDRFIEEHGFERVPLAQDA